MIYKHTIGLLTRSNRAHKLELAQNTDDLIVNNIIVDQMGGGKTNILMSIVFGMNKAYRETEGKNGALPIVLVPKFEWYKLGLASKDDNIAPDLNPAKMDANQITFPCCDKPEHIEMDQYSIEFNELTVEDIGTFANMRDIKDLGKIKAILNNLEPGYTIQDFIDSMYKENKDGDMTLNGDYSGLYYVFSTLQEKGLFDTKKYPVFDWEEQIKKLKPIIVNFGGITNQMFQALGGFLFRKLYKLADEYYNQIVIKKNRIDEAKQEGYKIDLELSERDLFFLKYFNLGILIDEAPRLFVATTSSNLQSFPATNYFQIISSNDGRKMGIKYTYLVTQFYKDIYFKFRKRSRFVWFGSRVSKEDRDFIEENKILDRNDIPIILKNDQFFFSIIDMKDYLDNFYSVLRLRAITKFRSYRSPSGVF